MRRLLFFSLLVSGTDAFSQIHARVIRVKDGDTFVGLWNGKTYNCRLAHADAPEIKQAYGIAARDSVSTVILGKIVTIDSLKQDLYGRVLVHVHVGKMRLDSLVIARGWAWQYVAYSKDKMLAGCMSAAAAAGLGLWGCGASMACPPWLYRKFNMWSKRRYSFGC